MGPTDANGAEERRDVRDLSSGVVLSPLWVSWDALRAEPFCG